MADEGKYPDIEIASRVKNKLISSMSETAIERIETGLGNGSLTPEDWVFIFENERPIKE